MYFNGHCVSVDSEMYPLVISYTRGMMDPSLFPTAEGEVSRLNCAYAYYIL